MSDQFMEKRLSAVMRRVRNYGSDATGCRSVPLFPEIYYEEATFKDRPYNLPLVVLKTTPCRWLLRTGGCTTCNYQQVASFKRMRDDDILAQVDAALRHLGSPGRFPYLHLTSSGSFLDRGEISDVLMAQIARRLDDHGVELFSTESRADLLLDEDRLEILRNAFPGRISVGMGIESADDEIRNLAMFKGVSTGQIEQAIVNLKKHGMEFHAYVLLGKPFLTVRENIEDAVGTARFAIERGGSALFMLANIQPNTLTHVLYEHGLYEIPSLWAPVEAMERMSPKERLWVSVKGIDKAVPQPEIFQKSCDLCTPIVRNAFVGFNWTLDYRIIEEVTGCCTCRDSWREKLGAIDERPLTTRIADALDRLEAAGL